MTAQKDPSFQCGPSIKRAVEELGFSGEEIQQHRIYRFRPKGGSEASEALFLLFGEVCSRYRRQYVNQRYLALCADTRSTGGFSAAMYCTIEYSTPFMRPRADFSTSLIAAGGNNSPDVAKRVRQIRGLAKREWIPVIIVLVHSILMCVFVAMR